MQELTLEQTSICEPQWNCTALSNPYLLLGLWIGEKTRLTIILQSQQSLKYNQ